MGKVGAVAPTEFCTIAFKTKSRRLSRPETILARKMRTEQFILKLGLEL